MIASDRSIETLQDWDKRHLWHPFTALADWDASDPMVIVGGEGNDLIDAQGRRYLDGVSSLWCIVHGHNHPHLLEALTSQAHRLAHSTLLGATHPAAIELARALADHAPGDLTRSFFSSDGASAVEVALKMAFQYWRQKPNPEPDRTLFLALEGAYHGDTLGDVSVGDVPEFHAMFRPLMFPVLRGPTPHPYRSPFGDDPEVVRDRCLERFDALLGEHAGRVAAVILEPLVQGAAGMFVHPPGFLRGLAELCKRHGTLLIADEVAMGFGRTGTLFACQQEDVVPDFLCLGKGLTGGYMAMSSTMTHDRIAQAFYGKRAEGITFYHGHTFSGNPLASALALANLEVFDQERTLEQLPAKIARFAARVDRLGAHPLVGEARQRGLVAGVELVADKTTRSALPGHLRTGDRICQRAREYGVLIRPLDDVVVLMPPLSVTLEQIDTLVEALERSLDDHLREQAA